MGRSFWTTVLKVAGGLFAALFAIAAISAQVLDVMNDGLTWQKAMQWIVGGRCDLRAVSLLPAWQGDPIGLSRAVGSTL